MTDLENLLARAGLELDRWQRAWVEALTVAGAFEETMAQVRHTFVSAPRRGGHNAWLRGLVNAHPAMVVPRVEPGEPPIYEDARKRLEEELAARPVRIPGVDVDPAVRMELRRRGR